MTLRGIRLENFRGFTRAEIQIKPLTVLLGPNSSGKSSFCHALAAMAHAHWLYRENGLSASLTPPLNREDEWPVELGGTADLRKLGTTGPVKIGLNTSDGWISLGFGGVAFTDDLILSYASYPHSPQARGLDTEPVPLPTAPETTNTIESPSLALNIGDFAPTTAATRIAEQAWRDPDNSQDVELSFKGLMLATYQHRTGTAIQIRNRAQNEVRNLLDTLIYLRGTRARPRRRFQRRGKERQAIGYGGEFTADALDRLRETAVRIVKPPPFDIALNEVEQWVGRAWPASDALLATAVGEWLDHIGVGRSAIGIPFPEHPGLVGMRVALDKGGHAFDVTEIGLAVSQLLPVIVGGLLQPEGSVFVVDLPEAHLHPRPQAALADFFAALALSGRYSIVETHSEMFFDELRYLAALHPTLVENTAVYFFDRPQSPGECELPRPIALDFEGETNWPAGFLHEGWELHDRIRAARFARSRR